jgi:hypothetical protein
VRVSDSTGQGNPRGNSQHQASITPRKLQVDLGWLEGVPGNHSFPWDLKKPGS